MSKQRANDDVEEAAVDHGDGDGSWFGAIAGIAEREREARADRISSWAANAGPPHAEVTLGNDPEYSDRVGFWRVSGGVIRIRASKKGEFDPAERIDITDAEASAIATAAARPCPEPPAARDLPVRGECSDANPCCDRANEYNGFASGPLIFACPKGCPCHD